jgi:hypothetical protein
MLDIETLQTISARLREHANSITNAARQDIINDLYLAARLADNLAALQSRVRIIAAGTIDPATRYALTEAVKISEA